MSTPPELCDEWMPLTEDPAPAVTHVNPLRGKDISVYDVPVRRNSGRNGESRSAQAATATRLRYRGRRPGGEPSAPISQVRMNDIAQHPDDFANAFESTFARLQIRIETACAAEPDWPAQVAAGIRAALVFAAAEPTSAQVLTNDALAAGKAGYARHDRMLDHFGKRLLPGRALHPEGERLPEIIEKAMTGGLAMLVAQRLDMGREAELPAATAEAIQFVLTPYLGTEEASRIAAASG